MNRPEKKRKQNTKKKWRKIKREDEMRNMITQHSNSEKEEDKEGKY